MAATAVSARIGTADNVAWIRSAMLVRVSKSGSIVEEGSISEVAVAGTGRLHPQDKRPRETIKINKHKRLLSN